MDLHDDEHRIDGSCDRPNGQSATFALPSPTSLKPRLVSAVYFSFRKRCVLILSQRLANFGCFFALASYSRRRDTKKKVRDGLSENHVPTTSHTPNLNWVNSIPRYASMLQMLFSMALTLYTW